MASLLRGIAVRNVIHQHLVQGKVAVMPVRNVTLPKGMNVADLKKNPSLIPLLFFAGLGVCWAAFYTLRLAVRSPEVNWYRKDNFEAFNEYSNKQYKFFSPVRDYSKIEDHRPKF